MEMLLAGMCARRRSHFLLFRQKKVTKEKATPLAASLRFAAGNLRCSRTGCAAELAARLRASLRQPQRVRSRSVCILRCTRSPRPLRSSAHPEGRRATTRAIAALGPGFSLFVGAGLPAMGPMFFRCVHRGQARSHTQSPRPSAAMARRGLLKAPLAVPRSAGRGAGAAAQHAALCALTRCGCSSGVSAANKASSAAPPHARASQVAPKRSAGDTASGVAFSLVTFFWRDKRK